MKLKQELLERFVSKDVRVGVVGLGYVGLPLGLTFVYRGFDVIGFDPDPHKVEALRRERSYIQRIGAALSSRFQFSADFNRLSECEAIIACVSARLSNRSGLEASLTATAQRIKNRLRRGQLILLESMAHPGTAEAVLKPLFEATGLRSGHDFFLAFSREREDSAVLKPTATAIPKLVGGCDPDAADLATALYAQIFERIVRVTGTGNPDQREESGSFVLDGRETRESAA